MLDQYRQVFSKLRTDANPARWSARTYHHAPHKPLLLLSVMDLFAQGSITSNLIELGPELGELFTLCWSQVMEPGRRGNLAMPFFHLRSDRGATGVGFVDGGSTRPTAGASRGSEARPQRPV